MSSPTLCFPLRLRQFLQQHVEHFPAGRPIVLGQRQMHNERRMHNFIGASVINPGQSCARSRSDTRARVNVFVLSRRRGTLLTVSRPHGKTRNSLSLFLSWIFRGVYGKSNAKHYQRECSSNNKVVVVGTSRSNRPINRPCGEPATGLRPRTNALPCTHTRAYEHMHATQSRTCVRTHVYVHARRTKQYNYVRCNTLLELRKLVGLIHMISHTQICYRGHGFLAEFLRSQGKSKRGREEKICFTRGPRIPFEQSKEDKIRMYIRITHVHMRRAKSS